MAHRFVLGLDLSFRSPGITLLDRQARHLHCFFFPARKRDIGLEDLFVADPEKRIGARVHSLQITALTPFGTGGSEQKVKKHAECLRFRDILRGVEQVMHSPEDTLVIIEGYAYGTGSSSSSGSKLFGLGALVRQSLWEKGVHWEVVAPTAVKKQFSGTGRADKLQMYCSFREKLPWACFLHLFGTRFDVVTEVGRVPSPVDDIVDSIALVSPYLVRD